MVAAVGGAGALLLLCVVGYFAASGGGPSGVPVIQPPLGPVKTKPADPGGMQVSTQTSSLLGNNGSVADANLAPAPEVPDPAALAAAANQEQTVTAPPAAAASAPVVSAVPVPQVPETPAPSAPPQSAMTVPPPSAGAAAVHNLAQEDNPPPQATGQAHVRVQLAALGSQEAALHEWDRLTRRMPALFDGRHPIFAEAHVNGHTYWRVRTAGFVSVTEAAHFCSDVHARGAACTVATF